MNNQEVSITHQAITYTAHNKSTTPSLVVASKGDEIVWQKEFSDSQFVTSLSIKMFQSKETLYVSCGEGVEAVTYVVDCDNGELLNVLIISPPPVD